MKLTKQEAAFVQSVRSANSDRHIVWIVPAGFLVIVAMLLIYKASVQESKYSHYEFKRQQKRYVKHLIENKGWKRSDLVIYTPSK